MRKCTWMLLIERKHGHQVPGDGLMVYEYQALGDLKTQLDKYFSIYGDNAPISINTSTGVNYHHQDGTDNQINKIMSINYDKESSLFRIVTTEPLGSFMLSITITYIDAEEEFWYDNR